MPRWPCSFFVCFFLSQKSLTQNRAKKNTAAFNIIRDDMFFHIFKALFFVFFFSSLGHLSCSFHLSSEILNIFYSGWLHFRLERKEREKRKRKWKGQSTRPFWDRDRTRLLTLNAQLARLACPFSLWCLCCPLCLPFLTHREIAALVVVVVVVFGCYQSIEIPDA